MTIDLPFSYPLVTLYLTFSYPVITFYLPFTYPCFGKVLWYKRKEANGAEKARRENYESYLYLPFTYPCLGKVMWYKGRAPIKHNKKGGKN